MASTKTPSTPDHPPRRSQLDLRLRKARIRASLFRKPADPIVIDRFTLLERLGSGSMGEVYAAYDNKLDRKVALKLVRGRFNTTSLPDKRLLREAKTLAKLSHPNVVQIYDAGEVEENVFIAMEFIRGTTMTHRLADMAKTPRARRQREILRLFVEAGRGLEAAHQAGLTHRDFKPDNIMVGHDGRPRVVDFGLARIESTNDTTSEDTSRDSKSRPGSANLGDSAPPDTTMTPRGMVMGTPAYMAPEVLAGRAVDQRSDQFSFCVALFEALHGERPFPGKRIPELQAAMAEGRLASQAQDGSVPTPVRKALLRGLAMDPEQRFPDMGALLSELEAWPKRRRRLALAAAALACMALAGMYEHNRTSQPAPGAVCVRHAGHAIAEVWNDEVRLHIEEAMAGRSDRYAQSVWSDRIEGMIDGYVGSWREAYGEVCVMRGEKVLPEAVLDSRETCLHERRSRLAGILELAPRVDEIAPAATVQMLDRLPSIAECRRDGSNEARDTGHNDLAIRRLSSELQKAAALSDAGQHQAALELAGKVAEQAQQLDYPVLLARARLIQGWSAYNKPDRDRDLAIAQLENAIDTALKNGMLAVAVEGVARVTYIRGSLDAGQSLERARYVESLAAGLKSRTFAYSLLLNNMGTVYLGKQPDAAQGYFERAIRVLDENPKIPGAVELSSAKLNLAMLTNDPDRRRDLLEEVVTTYTQRLGANHPDTLFRKLFASHFILDPGQARDMLAPACEAYRVYHEDRRGDLLDCVYHLSFVLAELGRPDEAAAVLAGAPRGIGTEKVAPELAEGFGYLYAGESGKAEVAFTALQARRHAVCQTPQREHKKDWRCKMFADADLGLGMSLVEAAPARAVEYLERAHTALETWQGFLANNTEYQRRLALARVMLAEALLRAGERARREAALLDRAEEWYVAAGREAYKHRLQRISDLRGELSRATAAR